MTKKSLTSLLLIALSIILVSSPAQAIIKIDIDGNVTQTSPSVLGDDDEQNEEESKQEEKQEESKPSESNKSEESKKQEEQKREAEKKEVEKVREELKQNAEQEKKIRETNREIIKKIENEIKEEKQKNLEQIKLKNKNSLKVSLASESGEIEDLEDDEIEMETEHGIVSFKNSQNDDSIEITQGDSSAHTDLPLSIDPKTKKVSVESEGKELEVKILPEDALKSVFNNQTFSASPSGTPEKFEIVVENGQVVYLINDTKAEKFLGLFSVSIPKEVKISGDTGETLESKQNFLSKVLDFLSI